MKTGPTSIPQRMVRCQSVVLLLAVSSKGNIRVPRHCWAGENPQSSSPAALGPRVTGTIGEVEGEMATHLGISQAPGFRADAIYTSQATG